MFYRFRKPGSPRPNGFSRAGAIFAAESKCLDPIYIAAKLPLRSRFPDPEFVRMTLSFLRLCVFASNKLGGLSCYVSYCHPISYLDVVLKE